MDFTHCTSMHIRTHARIHIYTSTYAQAYTHTRMQRRLRAHVHTHVHTHTHTAPLFWNHCLGVTCRRVFGLQKKAIRIITKRKFNAHTEPLFRELSLLKVNHIFQLQCLKRYYNITNGRTPAFFSSMFVLNDTVHSYQTRHRGDIHIPLTSRTSAQNCIRQYVPRLSTTMPFLVISKVNTHSYIGFQIMLSNI